PDREFAIVAFGGGELARIVGGGRGEEQPIDGLRRIGIFNRQPFKNGACLLRFAIGGIEIACPPQRFRRFRQITVGVGNRQIALNRAGDVATDKRGSSLFQQSLSEQRIGRVLVDDGLERSQRRSRVADF